MSTANKIFKDALKLAPADKVALIEKLLAGLDEPDKEMDELWAKESEDRIDAYEQGELMAITINDVSRKYS